MVSFRDMNARFRFIPLLIGMVLFGSGCGNKVATNLADEDDSIIESNRPARNYRPGIAPSGSFSVTIQRLPNQNAICTNIADNDVILYKTGQSDHEYMLVSNGTELKVKRTDQDPSLVFMPSGKLKSTNGSGFGGMSSTVNFFNDGSFIRTNVMNIPGHRRATYMLVREWHNDQRRPTSYLAPPITLIKSEEIYRADNRVVLLEKTEKDVIWIQDHIGTENRGIDHLIRYDGGKVQQVAMPDGYQNVFSLAQTGDQIAATFGIARGELPYRAYVKTSSGWAALPIPAGYDFSFIKKVFRNGTILGSVTSSDSTKSRSVLWKGDKMVILDDLPGWPRQGLKSECTIANRSGLVLVEEDLGPGSHRPQYLLRISTN